MRAALVFGLAGPETGFEACVAAEADAFEGRLGAALNAPAATMWQVARVVGVSEAETWR